MSDNDFEVLMKKKLMNFVVGPWRPGPPPPPPPAWGYNYGGYDNYGGYNNYGPPPPPCISGPLGFVQVCP